MPYTKQETRDIVRLVGAKTGGDLNFLITEALQKFFVENGMNYQAIHLIYKTMRYMVLPVDISPLAREEEYDKNTMKQITPLIDAINKIDDNKSPSLTMLDTIAAQDAAFDEFKRRVVIPYENLKIYENGDVMRDEINDLLYTKDRG